MKKNIIFGIGVLVLFLSTPLLMDYLLAEGQLRIYYLDSAGIRGPFLNIPVFLEKIGIGFGWSSRFYLILMNLLCCLTSYIVCNRIVNQPYAALGGSICYSFSIYSVYIRYDTGSMGEMAAFALLPFAALGIYNLYSAGQVGQMVKGSIWLAAGLTGLFYASIPLAVITSAFTLPLCLIPGRKNHWFHRLGAAAASLAGSVVLSLPVLLPYGKAVSAGVAYISDGKHFWERGIQLAQLFQVFFGYNGGDIETSFSFVGIGLPLLSVLVIWILLRISGIIKIDQKSVIIGRILLTAACVSMLFSLDAFPWRRLSHLGGGIRIVLEQIGYPHRFLVLATLSLSILVSVLGACIMENRKKTVGYYLAGVIILNLLSGVYLMNDLQYLTLRGNGQELLQEWSDREYLLYISR